MKVIEIEGKSIEDAKRKAAKKLGIPVSQIDKDKVEILDEGKSGIFGFGVSRPAVVRVSYDVNIADIRDDTRKVLDEILKKMQINTIIADIHESETKVYIELESENSGLVIGKKGKTLEALQFLVNLIINKKTGGSKKIILDIESYRAKRERSLKNLSRDIARQVIKTGRPWTLDPMNPFERRLIHLTLQGDDRVTTKSEGYGNFRQVTVFPKNRRR